MNFCRDCRWLTDGAKTQPVAAWRCLKTRTDEVDLVSGQVYPHSTCRFVRNQTGPDCPGFEGGHNCLNPKESDDAHE